MTERNDSPSIRFGVIFIQLIFLFSITLAKEYESVYTQAELKAKYGQVGTSFNDGKSCHRKCDGKIMTCYYEMHAQMYDTMSALCGECANGTLSDCFNKGCVPGNGVERVIMSVNQELPGVMINCCKNDRIIVDVTNHMAGQGLAIHWHGLLQKDSPWFDGVPMVTQCPIASGNTFRYAFNASEAGTHVYHSHSGVHRSNGLVGRFNIYEQNDPNADSYDYDLAEHSILLIDWDNKLAEDMEPNIRSATNLPESLLINGFGSFVDPAIGKSSYAPMAVFYVERGKRHRFRIANAGSHVCPFELSIEGHNFTVIATDGSAIEPVVFERLVSSPGERFDVVLTARKDLKETLLAVHAVRVCETSKTQAFARIIFVDDIHNYTKKIEDHEPLKNPPAYESLNSTKTTLNHPLTDCSKLKASCIASLKHKQTLGRENLRKVKPTKVIPITFRELAIPKRRHSYLTINDDAFVLLLNNIANSAAPVPALIQDDSDVSYCNAEKLPKKCEKAKDGTLVCYCTHLIELDVDEVYDFVIIDGDDNRTSSHPMHLHGHEFQVIDMGTREQLENNKTAFAKDTHLPVIKDTVTVPRDGFVHIRLRATNPGYWIFHCHFDYHTTPGMVTVIKVGKRKDMLPPPKNFPTCGNYFMPIHKDSSNSTVL